MLYCRLSCLLVTFWVRVKYCSSPRIVLSWIDHCTAKGEAVKLLRAWIFGDVESSDQNLKYCTVPYSDNCVTLHNLLSAIIGLCCSETFVWYFSCQRERQLGDIKADPHGILFIFLITAGRRRKGSCPLHVGQSTAEGRVIWGTGRNTQLFWEHRVMTVCFRYTYLDTLWGDIMPVSNMW